jgi:hypothetical protein
MSAEHEPHGSSTLGSPPARAAEGRRFAQPGLVLALVAVLVLAGAFAYHVLPFARYSYEADPSDGDMLNALLRGLAGKPIYGDWRTGTVTLLYPPLFLAILALGHGLGLDPIVFFRSANLLFLLVSLVLVVVVASSGTRARLRVALPGVLAGLFLLSAWRQYFWIAPVHPAALLLVISLAACTVLVLRPDATITLALLCVSAVMAKQSGAVLLVAALVYLMISDRKRLGRFCGVAGLALGLAVALGELQSHGQFVRSILLHPGRAFAGPWVRSDNVFALAAEFYGGRTWMVPLLVLGLWATRRTHLFPLALVFIFDSAAQLYLARNLAGSASYLWFHFALACILAAQGWQWLLAFAAPRLRILASPRVPDLLGLLLAVACVAGDGGDLLTLRRQDLSQATRTSRAHAELVAPLVSTNAGKKWIVTRSSLAVVRAGAILDQEYATFAIAWTARNLIDQGAVRARVAAGEYGLVQLGPTSIGFDPLADVFAACFTPMLHLTLVYMGRPAPATILRYDGTRPTCQHLQRHGP